MAMDREALIATANGGFGILTSGVVTPDATWQLSPEVLKPVAFNSAKVSKDGIDVTLPAKSVVALELK